MKKSYINPNTECIALQSSTIMQSLGGSAIDGGHQGDARAPQRSVGSIYL